MITRKRKLSLNNKRNKNVFQTMNKIFNGNIRPKKRRKLDIDDNASKKDLSNNQLQRISELLFSLENEKSLYEKKLLNTTDPSMRRHYEKLIKKHEIKIKQLKVKQSHTESNRNQDSMYEMDNFKF